MRKVWILKFSTHKKFNYMICYGADFICCSIAKSVSGVSAENKLWVNIGDMFIKLPKENTRTMIQKGWPLSWHVLLMFQLQQFAISAHYATHIDQKSLDKEISDLRDKVKDKAKELEDKDGKKMAGFQLKPVTADELYRIRKGPVEEKDEEE